MKTEDKIEKILKKYPNATRDTLVPILQEVQKEYGCLSRDAVIRIGAYLGLPASSIYGVATFYNQFRFRPTGKYHILVCRGTTCHVKGASHLVTRLEEKLGIRANGIPTEDGLFSLEAAPCIGACGLAPVMSVNGKLYAGIDSDEKLDAVLDEYRHLKSIEDGVLE